MGQQEELIGIFEERQLAYKEYTAFIVNFVADTLGEAMYKLLECQPDQVLWDEVSIVEKSVVFMIRVSYTEDQPVPKFFQIVMDHEDREGDGEVFQLHQQLAIGIPLRLIFKPPAVIAEFVLNITVGMPPEEAIEIALKTPDVDASAELEDMSAPEVNELSAEQIQQILFLQKTTKGKIQ